MWRNHLGESGKIIVTDTMRVGRMWQEREDCIYGRAKEGTIKI